jgi:hypothetical protein
MTPRRLLDRRRALTGLGVVAGTAWVAPQILSVDAAAAATCRSLVLDWDGAFAPGVAPVPSGSTVLVGATTVTLSWVFAGATNPVATSTVDNLFSRTGQPRSYHMQLNSAAGATGPVTITLGFSSPVRYLAFRLLDIDASSGPPPLVTGWIDEATVTALNGINAAPGTGSTLGVGTDTIVADTTFRGNRSVANPSATDADIQFEFAGPLTTVTIVYRRAGATLGQGIGLSNLQFCGY